MKVANVYIDGFNLYHGCIRYHPHHKWLDLAKFAAAALPGYQISKVYYFTSHIKSSRDDPQQKNRQDHYLRALATLPNLTVHFGKFQVDKKRCQLVHPLPDGTADARVLVKREKGSDVKLAVQMLLDAVDGVCEAVAVVSDDADLIFPIEIVRARYDTEVIHVSPRGASHFEIASVASRSIPITDEILGVCQFPDEIEDRNGVIRRPVEWA